jgi:hypothetical protein
LNTARTAGSELKIIAAILEALVIERILGHTRGCRELWPIRKSAWLLAEVVLQFDTSCAATGQQMSATLP